MAKGTVDGEAADALIARLRDEALKSYPNAEGDPVAALAMALSWSRHQLQIAAEARNLNIRLGQTIAQLEARLRQVEGS